MLVSFVEATAGDPTSQILRDEKNNRSPRQLRARQDGKSIFLKHNEMGESKYFAERGTCGLIANYNVDSSIP